jgi:hypothetical protein
MNQELNTPFFRFVDLNKEFDFANISSAVAMAKNRIYHTRSKEVRIYKIDGQGTNKTYPSTDMTADFVARVNRKCIAFRDKNVWSLFKEHETKRTKNRRSRTANRPRAVAKRPAGKA